MTSDIFAARRAQILARMADSSLLVLFSGKPPVKTADEEYYYAPNRNFYYVSGIDREECALVLSKLGGATAERLYVAERSSGIGGPIDHALTAEDARRRSGISDVQPLDALKPYLERTMHRAPVETLYLDLERRLMSLPDTDAQRFAREMRDVYPQLAVRDAYVWIAAMRRVKCEEEIAEIRRAIEITRAGIEAMLRACRPGMYEYELEAEFLYQSMKRGQREGAFKPIIAAGKNSLIGHYAANNCVITEGDLVLADVGAASRLYASDISRAFPATGTFSARQRQLYEVLLVANKRIIESLAPGVTMGEANRQSTELVRALLAEIGLTAENSPGLSVYGGPNHYMGLDVHDVGLYDIPFAPGMVLAVESSVTIPDEGFSFRIEDDVLITEQGRENLSAAILKEIDQIERMMAR